MPYVTPAPLPTDHERELLIVLIEECSEVQKRATKWLRFGRDEIQPGQALTNGFRLGMEVGDLTEIAERCLRAKLFTSSSVEAGREQKTRQLAEFLQTKS